MILGQVRPPKESERYHGLTRVESVNGMDPETARRRPSFENLTPVFPDQQLHLETDKDNLSGRVIDLVAPVGRGQRGLIVAPPKAGKTTLLKVIANGISENYTDVYLMVALIGERPEEVTDVKRSIEGEVFSSTFDEPVEDHCRVAELALERAKRLVEGGRDVVILLLPALLKQVAESMRSSTRNSKVLAIWNCIWIGNSRRNGYFLLSIYFAVAHAVKSS